MKKSGRKWKSVNEGQGDKRYTYIHIYILDPVGETTCPSVVKWILFRKIPSVPNGIQYSFYSLHSFHKQTSLIKKHILMTRTRSWKKMMPNYTTTLMKCYHNWQLIIRKKYRGHSWYIMNTLLCKGKDKSMSHVNICHTCHEQCCCWDATDFFFFFCLEIIEGNPELFPLDDMLSEHWY